MIAGFRALARGPEENIFLHIARPIRRFPPWSRTRKEMFWVEWQAFIPGNSTPFAWGRALSPTGAESKAWKAYDRFQAARVRWSAPEEAFTDNAMCRDFHHDLLDPDWPKR